MVLKQGLTGQYKDPLWPRIPNDRKANRRERTPPDLLAHPDSLAHPDLFLLAS